jgi:uncharacterized protein (TIGR00297 family)
VTSTVRRAAAFAAVGSISLAAPLLQAAAAGPSLPVAPSDRFVAVAPAMPFAAIAAAAVFVVHDGPLFELFARPGERRERRLYGLIGFSLAATGLVLLSTASGMPTGVAVGAILLVAYGNLAAQTTRSVTDLAVVRAVAFAVGGGLGAGAGLLAVARLEATTVVPAEVVFLAASGALLGTLLRTILFESDDPHVMLTVGLWLWLLSTLATDVALPEVGLALAVTVALGYASYALETASIPGMLAGVSVGLVTIVLTDFGWFAVLIAFFVVGGLSTKFRYDRKRDRGVAEPDEGARGAANVLANAAVGLGAVLAYAAVGSPEVAVDLPRTAFLYVFVGSVATAMSDTLSSEVGAAFDSPRLVTTLEPVEPGTDGAVTWQGLVAGVAGAGLVAGLSAGLLAVGPTGAAVVVAAGLAGMTVDSLVGATLEGGRVGNGTVNFLATLGGGLVAVGLATGLGLL